MGGGASLKKGQYPQLDTFRCALLFKVTCTYYGIAWYVQYIHSTVIYNSWQNYVCMYVSIICHTLITWVQFLWSCPETTSHMVVVRPGGD